MKKEFAWFRPRITRLASGRRTATLRARSLRTGRLRQLEAAVPITATPLLKKAPHNVSGEIGVRICSMILRVRLRRGRPIQRKQGKNRHVALAFGGLLIPAALMAYVLGFWRLASDMGLAGEFGITGLFSHWQIWMTLAALLHILAATLNKYGRGGDLHMPRVLNFPLFVPRSRKGEAAPVERHAGSR